MIKSFKHTAPIAWGGKTLPCTGYGRIALALGQVLGGGLAAEGTAFRLDGMDFGLMCAQVMVNEAGLSLIVCGVGYDADDKHTFVAMSDGSVWRFVSYLEGGFLVTEAEESDHDTVANNCEESLKMVDSVKSIVVEALSKSNSLADTDSFSGHVAPDGHSAILLSCRATGAFIVRDRLGNVKGGWRFVINAPRNATAEEVSSVLLFQPMSEEDIMSESREYMDAIGMSGLFPVALGQA